MSSVYPEKPKVTAERPIHLRPIKTNETTTLAENKDVTYDQLQTSIKEAYDELERLQTEKADMIQQANARIEEARAAWETEKQQYIEQARSEGYADGYARGQQDGQAQYKQLLAEANQAVEAAKQAYNKTLEQCEEQLADLAVDIAEKIMHQTLHKQPDTLLPLVQAAIKTVKDKTEIALYLHAADYEAVNRQKEELTSLVGHNTFLSLYTDDELARGSCRIEHSFGRLDASIDAQLQKLRATLQEINREYQ